MKTRSILFYITIIAGLLLSLQQCEELASCGQKHFMNEEYKIEFNYGDILTYESSNGNQMQYYISYLLSGDYEYTQTGESASGCYAYYEFEIIGICPVGINSCLDYSTDAIVTSRPTQVNCPECLSIYKIMDTRPINDANKRIDNPVIQWKDKWESYVGDNSSTHSEISLNGTKYYDVYTFNNDFEDNGIIITTIYFNYKKGFIGYETQNGEVWNLI